MDRHTISTAAFCRFVPTKNELNSKTLAAPIGYARDSRPMCSVSQEHWRPEVSVSVASAVATPPVWIQLPVDCVKELCVLFVSSNSRQYWYARALVFLPNPTWYDPLECDPYGTTKCKVAYCRIIISTVIIIYRSYRFLNNINLYFPAVHNACK